MKRLFSCRRTFICVLGMSYCLAIALALSFDTTGAIMGIAIGLASANGIEGAASALGSIFTKKQ